MAEPFMAEIRLMSFVFPPQGWALCNGQFLPINQNQALFSLLGTTYGGNGQTTFALPDLRGRVPIHMGGGHTLGEKAGEQAHTISMAEMPAHIHLAYASNLSANAGNPNNTRELAPSAGALLYASANNLTPMAANSLTNFGGSQAHTNMQPYLTLSFCIALIGIFPSQT